MKKRKKAKYYRVTQFIPPSGITTSTSSEEWMAWKDYKEAISNALQNPGWTRIIVLQADDDIISSLTMGQ